MRTLRFLSVALVVLCVAGVCHAGILGRPVSGRRGGRVAVSPRVAQTPRTYSTTRAGSRLDDHPLLKLIRETQLTHVGISEGPEDYQCFTWEDLKESKASNVPAMVASTLRNDPEFLAVVDQIRQMTAADRNRLLHRASLTCKPTWARLGRITPEGQTVAGQQAELLLARAIVGLVRELLSNP